MAPEQDDVAGLVEPIVVAAGFDVDDVTVTRQSGGGDSAITVIVDGEHGVGLDALTDLTRALTARFDEEPWAENYALDVMSRGVESPLTLPRHWRRNHGRKVELVLRDEATAKEETLVGRIGNLDEDSVAIVLNTKGRLSVRTIPLATVASAVVTVEFGEPSKAEMKLCRGED